MDKEKLNERFLRIHFVDNAIIIDVNNEDWKKILSCKEKIIRIESNEWEWDLSSGKIIVFQ